MSLDEQLKQMGACEGETRVKVKLKHGNVISGVFADYTDASDNVEEVASMDVENEIGNYCLLETEIVSIDII